VPELRSVDDDVGRERAKRGGVIAQLAAVSKISVRARCACRLVADARSGRDVRTDEPIGDKKTGND